jgi:putative oxidoreductase
MGFLSKLETPAYALMRLVLGAMFALHGAQKILGFLAKDPSAPLDLQMQIGGVIELAGGALIAVGLLTRIAAFLSSGTMAVAYFQFHWPILEPVFDDYKWIPLVNHGEAAVFYCLAFLFIATKGPGPVSLDRLFRIDKS